MEAISLSWEILSCLAMVAALAGFVDTLAGGGGMLTIPTLMLTGLPVDVSIATSKLQATVGVGSVSWYFIKRKQVDWQNIIWAIVVCLIGSAIGAKLLQIVPNTTLQLALPAILIVVAILFLLLPNLGKEKAKVRLSLPFFLLLAIFPIGLYDGFLGSGGGTFLMLMLVLLRGEDITHATIHAKILNASTSIAALSVFLIGGKIYWTAGLIMAVGQFLGARFASRMIVHKGHAIIRPMVIAMSIIMSVILMARYWF